MKPVTHIFLLMIISGLINYLQAQTYNVTVSSEPFAFLENPESAVKGPWDDPEFQLPIGFEFDFFDISSDQLYSSPNSFGGYTSLNQDEESLYMLIHFYADLIDIGYQLDSSVSKIYFKTVGPIGQRVFILEYNNAGILGGLEDENGVFLDYINLQIRLHEDTGDIEFHIGPNSILEDPEIVFDGYPGPFIGLFADANNTPGGNIGEVILLSGDPLNPTLNSDPFSSITWPIPENTIYRFSRMGASVGDYLSDTKQPFFFPNPTYGNLHLNSDISKDIIYPIIVLDVLGKPCVQWNSEIEISAAGLAAGSYYAIVHTESMVGTEKILVLPK